MFNISQVILARTDNNLCRKELTVHWSAPNSLIRPIPQPCTISKWGDESEAVAPIIWLYQTVDAWKEEVFFPNLLITLRRYGPANFNGYTCTDNSQLQQGDCFTLLFRSKLTCFASFSNRPLWILLIRFVISIWYDVLCSNSKYTYRSTSIYALQYCMCRKNGLRNSTCKLISNI